MIKRCMSIFVVFLLIFSLANVSFIIAQEDGVEDPGADNFETDDEEVVDEETSHNMLMKVLMI